MAELRRQLAQRLDGQSGHRVLQLGLVGPSQVEQFGLQSQGTVTYGYGDTRRPFTLLDGLMGAYWDVACGLGQQTQYVTRLCLRLTPLWLLVGTALFCHLHGWTLTGWKLPLSPDGWYHAQLHRRRHRLPWWGPVRLQVGCRIKKTSQMLDGWSGNCVLQLGLVGPSQDEQSSLQRHGTVTFGYGGTRQPLTLLDDLVGAYWDVACGLTQQT